MGTVGFVASPTGECGQMSVYRVAIRHIDPQSKTGIINYQLNFVFDDQMRKQNN